MKIRLYDFLSKVDSKYVFYNYGKTYVEEIMLPTYKPNTLKNKKNKENQYFLLNACLL